jgi:glycosyltransferase involved in cell wall biosynthesis
MRKHAGWDGFEVYVWDNGSCGRLRSWLEKEYRPDYLTLSQNVGKSNARKAIFSSFPPETIIAMSDDDIFFYPDWLQKEIAILRHFDAVQVTGYPVRTSFRWGCEKTIERAKSKGQVHIGRFLPENWENDFAVSIGRDPAWHKSYSANDLDYRWTYKGMQAYCTSHHCQFVAEAGRILPALSWSPYAMADEKPFDIAVDEIGLRLATVERLSRHIGNVIDSGIAAEAKRFNF